MEGVTFYLKPDFSKITPKLFIFVLGQVFFALSLGFRCIDYPLQLFEQGEENLIQTAVITGFTNTIIAVLCGFMIFPSLFTFGIEPNAGPTLVFQSLPIVFSHLWAGKFFCYRVLRFIAYCCINHVNYDLRSHHHRITRKTQNAPRKAILLP